MKTKRRELVYPLVILGLIVVLAVSCDKDDDKIKEVVDIDGNAYKVVTIGTQDRKSVV